MKRQLRAASPALVISLIALFVALGGTAYASGLISGSQIKNHSIPARKLTRPAIKSLHGQRGPIGPQGLKGDPGPKGDTGLQGPGAISFIKSDVLAGGGEHVVTTIDGLDVYYECSGSIVVGVTKHSVTDTLYASGEAAQDGTLLSVQTSGTGVFAVGTSTANLDVIAWAGSVGTISRFDLGGYYNGVNACNVWGLITPGSS